MSNKHSDGPRCPVCHRRFSHPDHLRDHQKDRGHGVAPQELTEEERARRRMQAYHQDKLGGGKS